MKYENLLNTFIELVKIDTSSKPNSNTVPSTLKQLKMAEILEEKLKNIGMEDVSVSKYGYVTGKINANTEKLTDKIGFIAHMDTSPEYSGKNVQPQIIHNYDGEDIILKDKIIISPKQFPYLLTLKGQTIITADGTTLLGADDKAGIAEIITAIEYIINNPNITHCEIHVCFTPDEEIGKGADYFDVDKFGCDYAYTIDGGELGELNYETFNASHCCINIKGKSVHPGSAKGVMVNAANIASEFISMIPKLETPENTDKKEGFYHLININAEVSSAKVEYIIRDFTKEGLNKKKEVLRKIADNINERYAFNPINIDIKDEYENMYEILKNKEYIIERAKKAYANSGVNAKIVPVRGGTDGSRLSFMNLPCPNIFTGGQNFHGPYEYISLESMEKAVDVIINTVIL